METNESFFAEQAKQVQYIRGLIIERLNYRPEFLHMRSFIEEAPDLTIWGFPEATIFMTILTYLKIYSHTGKAEGLIIDEIDTDFRKRNIINYGNTLESPRNLMEYLSYRAKIGHNGFDFTKEVPGFLDYCIEKITLDWSK